MRFPGEPKLPAFGSGSPWAGLSSYFAVMNEIHHALRQLLRYPVFSVSAALVLALGIGANSAVFSLINAFFWQPIVAHDPGRLTGIFQRERINPGHYRFFSYSDFAELQEENPVFIGIAAFCKTTAAMREKGLTQTLRANVVTANFFRVLGVAPALGRTFEPDEEREANPVAVLSHEFWTRLGADPGLVGQTLPLTRGNVTVIGVMPHGFTGVTLAGSDLFLPTGAADLLFSAPGSPPSRFRVDRLDRRFMLFGRFREGMDAAGATAALRVISERYGRLGAPENEGFEIALAPTMRFGFGNRPESLGGPTGPLWLLSAGLAGTVLLVACLNLANLMLARGVARRKEIAVRLAIGAGRRRILRQLLTEALVLSLAGGAIGLGLAMWTNRAFLSFLGAGLSESVHFDPVPDLRTLAAFLVLCALATLFFALGPALKLARVQVGSDLKVADDARPRSRRLLPPTRHLLAIGQVAFSLGLLAAAALFMRSSQSVLKVDAGFDLGSHLVARLSPGLTGQPPHRSRDTVERAGERIAVLPGVESLSLGQFLPLAGERWERFVQRAGSPHPRGPGHDGIGTGEPAPEAIYNKVGEHYFRTLGVPLLRGREFTYGEVYGTNAPKVAVVSANLAEQLWPGEDPIDREIQLPGFEATDTPERLRVVGVVASFAWDVLDRQRPGYVFAPLSGDLRSDFNLQVRVAPGVDPSSIATRVREILQQIDPEVPLTRLSTLEGIHRDGMSVRVTRMGALLFGAFGLIALMITAVGIYGLQAFLVARREREIGIRLALGSPRNAVLSMILAEGGRLGLTGFALGVPFWLAVSALSRRFLFGVSALDPWMVAGVPLALAAPLLLACWIPARRAARLDPARTLRGE